MSQIDTEQSLAKADSHQDEDENRRLVPVSESIRYRKRAQSAEKEAEVLAEQLEQAKTQVERLSGRLEKIEHHQQLTTKLANAGAIDVEGAVAIAQARLSADPDSDAEQVIEQLKREKQYLFAASGGVSSARKTAGVRERPSSGQAALVSAAKRAATTGNRTDLQEYLKLRRSFV